MDQQQEAEEAEEAVAESVAEADNLEQVAEAALLGLGPRLGWDYSEDCGEWCGFDDVQYGIAERGAACMAWQSQNTDYHTFSTVSEAKAACERHHATGQRE